MTLTDTTLAADVLNIVNSLTTGAIDASSVITITGTAADINIAYASPSINGLGGDETVTLSETTVIATDLNTLDNNTTGSIDASTVTTITGAADDINTAYASSGITGLSFIPSSFVQIGDDIDGEAANDQSGHSVSLSKNGSIVAIGATHNNGNGYMLSLIHI